jgi:PHD/YefM family antitoxin component YafN of YafNO toxin-antitoxin module
MNTPPAPVDSTAFKAHLDSLRDNRRNTEKVVAILCPGQENAGNILTNTWEAVYDYLAKHDKNISLDQLHTVTAAVYKLAQSTQQITSLEHKILEFEDRRAQLRANAERARATVRDQPGLPPDIRAQIEHDLNLLN